ncbi:hypothetical protein MAQA_16021 [Listeria aquatica FSL S10-1188]|uniref:Uncharacterized protein n=1 Tax=Listeria aquatica FSL S10-1188 TaxID=1265818 RepID=W7B9C4_9LIST|nr:hypothetical protein MAQA_16021 [Listeria aquatica FSL S10-1188]
MLFYLLVYTYYSFYYHLVVYLLFKKKWRSKSGLIFILVLILIHTAMIVLYTDPYIYLDEGGISEAKFSQLFRWLAIISGILLVIIYGWKFRETRGKVK